MKRLWIATTNFDELQDAQLQVRAYAVVAGLTANAAYFAAPPFIPGDLSDLRGAFLISSADAIKGSKAQTQQKSFDKKALIRALKANATYVNQRCYTEANNQNNAPDYENLRRRILSSGFECSKAVKRPNANGNTKNVVVLSTVKKTETGRMNVNGVLSVRVKTQKKYDSSAIKSYWIQYRKKVTSPTPVNAWDDFTSTTSNIQVTGLISGIYEYQVAPIAGTFMGKDQLNWSNIGEVIVT